MNVNHYWRKKWWEEYGVKVKRIRIHFNPFNFWGTIPDRMYILYSFNSYGFKELLTNRIFTHVEEIDEYLKEITKSIQDKLKKTLNTKEA